MATRDLSALEQGDQRISRCHNGIGLSLSLPEAASNEDLEAAPERVNEDPYGDGWICEMRTEGPTTDGLLDASAYLALIEV